MSKDSFSLASLDSSLKEGAKGKQQIPCSPSKRESRGNRNFLASLGEGGGSPKG